MSHPVPTLLTWRALPEHLLVLATALAIDGEQRPMRVLALLRGLVIQLTFRMLCGEVLIVPGRAVLLWSVVHAEHQDRGTRLARLAVRTRAMIGAAMVGAVFVLMTLGGALLLLDLVLQVAQVAVTTRLMIMFGLAGLSLGATAWRALVAYAAERRREHQMHARVGSATWRVDLLGAPDKGEGFGGDVLDAFVRTADAAHAQVYLLTRPENEGFYRRHGLRRDSESDGLLVMRRSLRSTAPAA